MSGAPGRPAPLAGVRVLDLTRLLPGGLCTLLLADFGADVLKVEDTGAGDYLRWSAPAHEGVEPSAASAAFLALNRGKRSIRVDLKTAGGREVLGRLAAGHDVLVESFRPGVMDRLGVGFEVLRARNPALVWCAITGYGQQGPHAGRAGHDLNYLALCGLLALSGEAGGPPVTPPVQVADLAGGAWPAAFGVLAALRERERSGRGQLVDVSMFEGALSMLVVEAARALCVGGSRRRGEPPLSGGLVCYRPYRCADGWVALAALEPRFWRAWCEGVGRADLVGSGLEGAGSAAHRAVEEVMASRTRAEWAAFAADHECCLEPVLELDEALGSELVAQRGLVVEVAQPGAARAPGALAVPVRLADTPADPARGPAPGLGEHTEEVLRGLGYEPGEIAELTEQGAVAGPTGATGAPFPA